MKKTLVVLIIFLTLTSIPLTVYLVKRRQELRKMAAPATTLSLSPSSITRNVGETFSLDVVVDTGENTISAAEIYVIFDSSKLEGQSILAGNFLPVVLVNGNISGGLASMTLGSQPNEPKQGRGTLTSITFRAVAATEGIPIEIRFGANTQVAGIEEQGNVLTGTTLASVTILAAGPTLTPTPPTGPTVTPSPTPTSPPGATPTPTTAPTVTPTPPLGGEPSTPTPTPTPSSETGLPETSILTPTILGLVSGFLFLLSGLMLRWLLA